MEHNSIIGELKVIFENSIVRYEYKFVATEFNIGVVEFHILVHMSLIQVFGMFA